MVMTLAKSGGVLWVVQERRFGVGVGVDETGRDSQTGSVDDPPGVGLAEIADRRDLLAFNPNVRAEARCS